MCAFKKIILLLLALPFLCCLGGCSRDAVSPDAAEYILKPEDMANYRNWKLGGYKERPDVNQYRRIFFNKESEAGRVTGNYPVGSIIVKEISKLAYPIDSVFRYQIMVKRGGTYNPTGNGWEWILIDKSSTPLDLDKPEKVAKGESKRGDQYITVGGNTCIKCHANHNDLVIGTYDQ